MAPEKNPPKKWKPPKGPKPVHHKNKNTIGLGRTIQNSRSLENRITYLPDGEMRFTTEKHEDDWVKMRSITQENALDEFLNTAQLADTDFTAEKQSNIKIIKINNNPTSNQNSYLLTKEQEQAKFRLQQENASALIVPRRPKWDSTTTKYQLERQENEAFLEWRRTLASLQENNDLLLTPFERNIMVWKQLWRVIERSDLIVQIVDARNPLLFRSIDLEKYVKELDPRKRNLLLVNKADLLTQEQRTAWAHAFVERGIKFTFFSAATANAILEQEKEEEELLKLERHAQGLDSEDSEEEEDEEDDAQEIEQEEELSEEEEEDEEEEEKPKTMEEMTRIITVDELESLFLRESPEPLTEPPAGQPKRLQIGLVGYPNVGKSSTINALVGAKKVSVSSTPGKTKHFQTIFLSDEVILCDCPGLVFPNFAYTNGELVCNGVLPIDQLREITGPCQLVAQRIPKFFLEAVYGIAIPTKSLDEGGTGVPTSQELLTAYARSRGYMTQGFGSADESRAARYILKDYVNGKLLYVEPPPNADGSKPSNEEAREFNKGLFTLDNLSETRRDQLINAAREKGIPIDEIDLSKDLNKLTFSSHLGVLDSKDNKAKTRNNYGGKQAALISAGDELDNEFFKMNSVKGSFNLPAHLKAAPTSVGGQGNKKHNKKNKSKMAKKGSIASQLF